MQSDSPMRATNTALSLGIAMNRPMIATCQRALALALPIVQTGLRITINSLKSSRTYGHLLLWHARQVPLCTAIAPDHTKYHCQGYSVDDF